MERREQFLQIVEPFSSDRKMALSYVLHLEEFFDAILPERIGADFEDAIAREDYASAIGIAADYYRKKEDFPVKELSGKGEYDLNGAERYMQGIAREINIDWHFPNREVDFLFDPTEVHGPRNHEWLWQFNRHNPWSNLGRAYTAMRDEAYAIEFEKQLLKWIGQTVEIPEKWNGPGSAWRTIECGLRLLGSWPVSFDAFKHSAFVCDAALLLMIASMHRQAEHLALHPTRKNWLMMEANGLFTFSTLFSEFSDSKNNRALAVSRLLEELEKQILPDGMHDELSPDYQFVVWNCVSNFYSISLAFGMENEIPESFVDLMKRTVRAATLLCTPSFTQPRTNDTYTIDTERFMGRAEAMFGEDPVYRFVNSRRAEGDAPCKETASAFLPYAGFAVMRSDWDADATYMCFDVGPLGMGHEHQDKLNINIYKGAQELIYDDGGGQYEISPIRDYAISSYGHNVALVDGLPQRRSSPRACKEPIDAGWITNDVFDYATAVYDDVFGEALLKPATHKREVRFCKPDFFCVSDTLSSLDGSAHEYEILFHMDTTRVKALSEYENAVISDFGKEYEIAIIPLEEDGAVTLHTASAVTEPMVQGWYVGRNESNVHAAITVSRKVTGVRDFKFHTLLVPLKSGEALPVITKNERGDVSVEFKGKVYRFNLNRLDLFLEEI